MPFICLSEKIGIKRENVKKRKRLPEKCEKKIKRKECYK